ncbi:MAG: LysE family translocator [Gammaproteobacteria bacterium]
MSDVSWLLFLIASIVVILTPGQDMILVMSRSLSHGSRAGVVTALGVSTGLMGHTLLATFGLGAVLQTSELLFTLLKLAGAAYLLYLGFRLLTNRQAQFVLEEEKPTSRRRLFAEGALSNLSNPKIALFYFAFLPQFIPSSAERPTWMLLALGTTFSALTFLIKGPIGLFAGYLSGWIRQRPQALAWLFRCSGITLIGLGLRLALAERR